MTNAQADITYKKLKKHHGERFARAVRNYHSGLLDIPELDRILAYAGSDPTPLFPYLMSLMVKDETDSASAVIEDPFVLLDRAGYNAFVADDFEKQNSISSYFKQGELLCTFNDRARYQNYYIVHAVKKDADNIKRDDFNGIEERQDAYGTSVISIQILKKGGFISIKNRYNHKVAGCDNTFNSNPDNIILGLSAALKKYFQVDFDQPIISPPEGYALFNGQIFKYNHEINNIYYGDQAYVKDGRIIKVDRANGDALFGPFLFDNKSKSLIKLDQNTRDGFAADFNEVYGGNRGLSVQNGNLVLDGQILIEAEQSRIIGLCLPAFTYMNHNSFRCGEFLRYFHAPNLRTMATHCLQGTPHLNDLDISKLETLGGYSLSNVRCLTHLSAPMLKTMGKHNFYDAYALTHLDAPVLTSINSSCFSNVHALENVSLPSLRTMGEGCFQLAHKLIGFSAPNLTEMDESCLRYVHSLVSFHAPSLQKMRVSCLYNAPMLPAFSAPALEVMEDNCLNIVDNLTHFSAPLLTEINVGNLLGAKKLATVDAPLLTKIGKYSLAHAPLKLKFALHAKTIARRLFGAAPQKTLKLGRP